MTRDRPLLLALFLMADGGMATCAPVGAGQPCQGAAANDSAISAGIQVLWASDRALTPLALRAESRSGHVLLRGVTPDTRVRRRAAELARSVPGVRSVDNQISVQVLPPRSDER